MIDGIDSSFFKPTPAAILAARAAGVRIWSGYLATKPGVKLAAPWSKANFDLARQLGAKPLAFVSGWDDPVACKNLAAEWNVRLALDVEDGIRGNGPWVQGWLDASGAGLYANYWGFPGKHAPFYILTAYPGYGDPISTWNQRLTPRPDGPCGWQWVGTHDEFGGSIDRGDYDDWFAASPALERARLANGAGGGAMALVTGADGRIHRVTVAEGEPMRGYRGGDVHWAAVTGGSGGFQGWGGWDGPVGGWIASGTLDAALWQYGSRELIVIQGRDANGYTVMKALYTDDYSTLQDWVVIPGPRICVPGSVSEPGPVGPVGPVGPAGEVSSDIPPHTHDVGPARAA